MLSTKRVILEFAPADLRSALNRLFKAKALRCASVLQNGDFVFDADLCYRAAKIEHAESEQRSQGRMRTSDSAAPGQPGYATASR